MERNSKGQFTAGNAGGPGRPKRQVEGSYIAATLGTVSKNDWCKIVEKIKQKALRGDMTAARFLSDLLVDRGEVDARLTALEEKLGTRKE